MKLRLSRIAVAIALMVTATASLETAEAASPVHATYVENRFTERLTPDNSVILLVDFQPGLIYGVRDIDSMQLVINVVTLARGAKGLGVPIVVTSVTGGPFGSTIPELTAELPKNSVITRSVVSAWDDPRIVEAIRRTGRKNIIIAGTSTDVCLTFPALGALADGYKVYAVMDASGTWNTNLQNITLARLTQAGVIPVNTPAVLVDMLKDNNSPKAGVVYGALSNFMPAAHFMNQVAPKN
jgi:nicotinamidase-related amidase